MRKSLILIVSVVIVFVIIGALVLYISSRSNKSPLCNDFLWEKSDCGYISASQLSDGATVHRIIGKIINKKQTDIGYIFSIQTMDSSGNIFNSTISFPDKSIPFAISTHLGLKGKKGTPQTERKRYSHEEAFSRLPVNADVILNVITLDSTAKKQLEDTFPDTQYSTCMSTINDAYISYIQSPTLRNRITLFTKKLSSKCEGPVVLGITQRGK